MAEAGPVENGEIESLSEEEREEEAIFGKSVQQQPEDAMGAAGTSNGVNDTDKYGFLGGVQGTSQAEAHLPLDVVRRRELKWISMLGDWEKWMAKRFKKVRERCRKGIPHAIRARAWQQLTGSHLLLKNHTGVFQEYLRMQASPKWEDDIDKDLHRNFPQHELFTKRGGFGQQDLRDVLIAYTIHNPAVGYCQAMAPIVAVLLMHMPAEQAFWTFVAILQTYMKGYFSPGLEQVQIDGEMLLGLLKRTSPGAHKLLKKQTIHPTLIMTEWFMCLFTRTLPWPSVLRVLDLFFCEGVKVLFWVALVLIQSVIGTSAQQKQCPSMFETLEAIKNFPAYITEEDMLIKECLKLRVTQDDMDRENALQMAKFKAKASAKQKSDKSRGKSKERR